MVIAALHKEQVHNVFQCNIASVMSEACSILGLAGRFLLHRQLQFIVVATWNDL